MARKTLVELINDISLVDLFKPFYYVYKGYKEQKEEEKEKQKVYIKSLKEDVVKSRIEELNYQMGLIDYLAKYSALFGKKQEKEKRNYTRRKPIFDLKIYKGD